MTTELTTTQQQAIAAPNASKEALGALWSHAKMLSESDVVPKTYQGKPANCVIAIELAARLGSSPLLIMQSLHIIQGRPSWSSQFLIGSVNSTKRFTPLRFKYEGKPESMEWSCRAVAKEIESGEVIEGPKVSMKMAKEEGWLTKTGSKWQTMPEMMLAYRAAAFWTRLNCPEVSMGLHTSEEHEDMIQVTAQRTSMPDDIRTALLAEGTVSIPEPRQPEPEPESSPVNDSVREPGQEG